MKRSLINILRCPFCSGYVSIEKKKEVVKDDIRYGILFCSECAAKYPIVEGIVIFQTLEGRVNIYDEADGAILFKGPEVSYLVHLIEMGRSIEAFAALLNPLSHNGTPFLGLHKYNRRKKANEDQREIIAQQEIRPKEARFGRIKYRINKRLMKYVLPRTRATLAKFLYDKGDELSAIDLIDLYYRKYSGSEMANYFKYRFGQPRHLAALSLASLLSKADGPILDLACGVGHITHYLANIRRDKITVGIDHDFFRLYIAKNSIVPSADFICCNADGALPFKSSAFQGSICSDAFHYFPNQWGCARELKRLIDDDGIIILACVGNVKRSPNESHELSAEGYSRLFEEMPTVTTGEEELRSRYLEGRGPDLSRIDRSDELENQKWLSIIASKNQGLFSPQGEFEDWPHATGRLNLNPLYVHQVADSKEMAVFKFEFPSRWYEFEDAAYTEYAPPIVELSDSILEAIAQQRRTEQLEKLIRTFVIIGMPENYLKRSISA